MKTRVKTTNGFTLLEGVISMLILAGVGATLMSAFSFSVGTQKELRTQMEATRSASEILEILRATSFDALTLVENGGLQLDPLGKFQALVLADIEDRLNREGLKVYLTIREYLGREEMKYISLVIASDGVPPQTELEDTPPGKTLVKFSTFATQRGINP